MGDLVSRRLSWDDVLPERRQLDLGLARAVLETVVERALYLGVDEQELEERIDEELTWHFGIWLSGWRSGPQGGPVRAYDPVLSPGALLQVGQTDCEPAVRLTLAALVEWQEYLEALDWHFAALPDTPSVAEATSRLLPVILAMTRGRMGWQCTLGQALSWYLESLGYQGAPYRASLRRTVEQVFRADRQPSLRMAEEMAAFRMPEPPREREHPWQEWLSVRGALSPPDAGSKRVGPLRQDGHLEHIERKERDSRFLEALALCRSWAEGQEALTMPVLRGWHAVLVGSGDATPEPGERFEMCLRQSNEIGASAPWRAAVAYLDIRHAGLFADANHRLARLALDGILWRAGFALNSVLPIFVVARTAREEQGGGPLPLLVHALVGKRDV